MLKGYPLSENDDCQNLLKKMGPRKRIWSFKTRELKLLGDAPKWANLVNLSMATVITEFPLEGAI